jgi:DNA-binding MarR family transcriptional regulator
MKLEDEINILVPFASERQKVVVNLVYTYGVFLDDTLAILSQFDLNDQHFNILKMLNEQYPQPLAVGEIKRLLFNKRGDLTRLLDKLTDRELVVRDLDPHDRRVFLVTLSEKGREQLQKMDALLSTQREAKNRLTEAEARQLNDLLDKLRG